MATYFGIPPKVKQEYTAFEEVEYLGVTEHGKNDDDPDWLLIKFVYVNELLTEVLTAENSVDYKFKWSLRATYDYG